MATDNQIMEANAEGMCAFDDGLVQADNPHTDRALRGAWLEGWENAREQRVVAALMAERND